MQIGQEMSIVQFNRIGFDGTRIRSNNRKSGTHTPGELREAKKKLQEEFDRLNEKDDQEDAQDEGYGTAELSPWASVDVPVHRTLSAAEVADKLGTVGRPVPGVQLRIIVPEDEFITITGRTTSLFQDRR